MTILEKIIAHKKSDLAARKFVISENLEKSNRDFLQFLTPPNPLLHKRGDWPRVIAEIKKKSPSKGEIFPGADIEKIAHIYESSGAAAISCLTDEHFFGGSVDDLRAVSRAVQIPVLRKDFFLEESQIYEARAAGADAVLLMVSVLQDANILRKLRECSERFGMQALVETHSAEEIQIAVESGARIIGVNARDFTDLSIDLGVFQRLLPLIPEGIIRVAESGLEDVMEVEKVAPICDAILVGTNFMKLQDYEAMEKQVKLFTSP